jgi:hypothetical protein
MGVVYEVFDRQQRRSVALKTLLRFDGAALYRIKQEFRSLADVRHPNLVPLYELVVDDVNGAFFTMELVRGVDFLAHVGTRWPPSAAMASQAETVSNAAQVKAEPKAHGNVPPPPDSFARTCSPRDDTPPDWERLRSTLLQLVEGLHALHGAGHLHRDIKPSNVMVGAEGRVVILDLGVAARLSSLDGLRPSEAGKIVGTPKYMAPEQGLGEPPAPAADWYSVGAMLYEALVGRPPFDGPSGEVLSMKSLIDPPPPSLCLAGIPTDLDALCVALLDRNPARRPTGPQVLRLLGTGSPELRARSPVTDRPMAEAALMGRDPHLSELRAAFDTVTAGRALTVRVSGASGMGKSALVEHFVDGLVGHSEALVLRGRAYERELVPYKAIDGIVDELSSLRRSREEKNLTLDLPAGIGAVARIFPVLRRVEAVARAVEAAEESTTDPVEVRRRGFAAFRALLRMLAQEKPLVVYIDDVQWGDLDSAAMILDLVRTPHAPPLLLIMTHRDSRTERSAFLTEVRDGWPSDAEERAIALTPLAFEDARALALRLLGADDETARRTALAVASESGGNPFLVAELARSNRGLRGALDQTLAVLTLDQMVAERLGRLGDDARKVAELVAVGGIPLPWQVLANAALIDERLEGAVSAGRTRRLLDTGLREGRAVVQVSHDRFRETIVAQLPAAAVREHHERLARAMQQDRQADAEAIAVHLLGAGHTQNAAQYAEQAAQEALDKLAFDKAARLLKMALDHGRASEAEARRMRVRQAAALAKGGQASAAADAYVAAAPGAIGQERVEIEYAAAEQLLACGRIDEGQVALRRVLSAVGLSAPRTVLGAIVWLLVYRFVLFVRGFRFRERAAKEVSREDRVRIDALHAVSVGLGLVDILLGACMQERVTLLALRRGDAAQVLRALCVQLVHFGVEGRREGGKRETALLRVARDLAGRVGDEGHAYLEQSQSIALYLRGRTQAAIAAADAAPRQHRFLGDANTDLFVCFALFFVGRLREQGALARRLLREAQDRGDRYTVVTLRSTVMVDHCLMADDVSGARRHLDEAAAGWTQGGFRLQHWYGMFWGAEVDLYAGEPERAWERIERNMPALKRSFILHAANPKALTAYMGGCVAVAAAISTPPRRAALVKEARRRARILEGQYVTNARPLARILRASIANATAARGDVIRHLRQAIAETDAVGMAFHGAALRRRLGECLGGDEGQSLVFEADRSMTSEGVRTPARWANVLVPGQWGKDA